MYNIQESMLDVSIKSQDKVLKSKASQQEFLATDVQIYHKTDGVKLTVVKVANTGELTDYLFAYKGNLLFPEEYDYDTPYRVKRDSVGSSQFGLVFRHFQKVKSNSIPVGTELFIEYLMNKPTLSSAYSDTHKMVLIGYSKSSYTVKFGKLSTSPGEFQITKRSTYARELGIDSPLKLFSGVLGSKRSILQGITYPGLMKEFTSREKSFNWDNDDLLIKDIQDMLLAVDSKYGGKEEGVVVQYSKTGQMLKFQQEFQLDQNARKAIKGKYQEDSPETETQYWGNVTRVQAELALSISRKRGELPQKLQELSSILKNLKLDFQHSKKTDINIKDDIQVNAKTLIIKSLKGNNGALVLGKFRVLTKDGHVKLIKKALKEYDAVTICLVTSKETSSTQELRLSMLQDVFGSNPKINIIEARTGNLITIVNKSPVNINQVLQGSDRVSTYATQVQRLLGIQVQELERDNSQISASEVIARIEDESFFKQNTPTQVHKHYETLKSMYYKPE